MPLPIDARAIANEFLDLGDLTGVSLTNMALQKLVYLAHGWHLLERGSPLATNHFEAWEHGPVVRALYEAVKSAGEKPVAGRAMWFNALANRLEIARADLTMVEHEFLRRIFDRYGRLTAAQLRAITHEPGGPWDRVWNAGPDEIYFDQRIPTDLIRTHFSTHGDNGRHGP
jgi:uncharacterized phage-associated protein